MLLNWIDLTNEPGFYLTLLLNHVNAEPADKKQKIVTLTSHIPLSAIVAFPLPGNFIIFECAGKTEPWAHQ